MLYIACIILLCNCEKFEYSPYQTTSPDDPKELNAKNITRLMSTEADADDTVTVLFTGDSQRFYDELEDLVERTNAMPAIDFVVLAGDITDFGLLKEFEWVSKSLDKLHAPYICVIGNHDLIARGGEIYNHTFGPRNFSFQYKGYKFLFHDTNSREYNFNGSVPNMWWLSDQLKDSTASWFVGVAHVPPYNMDFDKTLEMPYKNLFSSSPRFILQLNGHLHSTSDSFYYHDHVRYITSNSVEKREVLLIKLIRGEIYTQKIAY